MTTDTTRNYSNILNGGQSIDNKTQTNVALTIKGHFAQESNILVIESDNGEINGFDVNGDLIRGASPLIKKVIGNLPIGKAVFFNGITWELANSLYEDTLGTHIVVESGLDGGMMRVQQSGYASVFSNLTPGNTYYVGTEGDITYIKPTDVGNFINPILVAETATSGWIIDRESSEILDDSDIYGDFLLRNPTTSLGNTVIPNSNDVTSLTLTHSGSSNTKLLEAKDTGTDGLATIGRSSVGDFYFQIGEEEYGSGCLMTGNGQLSTVSLQRTIPGLRFGCLTSNPDSNMIGLMIAADSTPTENYIVCTSSEEKDHFTISSGGTLTIDPDDGSTGIYIYSNGVSANYINCSGVFTVSNDGGIYSATSLSGLDDSGGKLTTRYGTDAISFEWASGTGNLYGRINNGETSMVIGTTSDYRVKNEHRVYQSGISDLKQFRPIVYTMKTEKEIHRVNAFKDTDFHGLDGSRKMPGGARANVDGSQKSYEHDVTQEQIGMLAHEVKEIIPSLVCRDKDEVDSKGNPLLQSIDYARITPILIQAVQELIVRVEALENL